MNNYTTVVPDANRLVPLKAANTAESRRITTTAFAFANGIAEQVYDGASRTHHLVIRCTTGETKQLEVLPLPGQNCVVAPVESDLIVKGRLLLPSQCDAYGTTKALLKELKEHVQSSVRLPKGMEDVVAYYILFTWMADRFQTAPYLRFIGDMGTGKSRALRVIGDLCYKPFKGSGSSSMAAIVRGIEQFGVCTLVLDESDFNARREEHQEMMNVLRTGFQREFGVLRAEREGDNFVPRDFAVYGPKLLAGRSNFPDAALESRCIRIYMQSGMNLDGMTPELPGDYSARAAQIRNKLLSWRLDHYFAPLKEAPLPAIEPRLQQVFAPLAAVIDEPIALNALQEIMSGLQSDMTDARKASTEGIILESLMVAASDSASGGRLYIKDLATKLFLRGVWDGSARQVASILRGFGLDTPKDRNGTFVVFDAKDHQALLLQYGLGETALAQGEVEEVKVAA